MQSSMMRNTLCDKGDVENHYDEPFAALQQYHEGVVDGPYTTAMMDTGSPEVTSITVRNSSDVTQELPVLLSPSEELMELHKREPLYHTLERSPEIDDQCDTADVLETCSRDSDPVDNDYDDPEQLGFCHHIPQEYSVSLT